MFFHIATEVGVKKLTEGYRKGCFKTKRFEDFRNIEWINELLQTDKENKVFVEFMYESTRIDFCYFTEYMEIDIEKNELFWSHPYYTGLFYQREKFQPHYNQDSIIIRGIGEMVMAILRADKRKEDENTARLIEKLLEALKRIN